ATSAQRLPNESDESPESGRTFTQRTSSEGELYRYREALRRRLLMEGELPLAALAHVRARDQRGVLGLIAPPRRRRRARRGGSQARPALVHSARHPSSSTPKSGCVSSASATDATYPGRDQSRTCAGASRWRAPSSGTGGPGVSASGNTPAQCSSPRSSS